MRVLRILASIRTSTASAHGSISDPFVPGSSSRVNCGLHSCIRSLGGPQCSPNARFWPAFARERGPEAIAALVKVMTKGKSEAARVAAANALLDRGWGRPKQSDEAENNAPLRCRTPASLEQSGMAGEVWTDQRADRGIAYIWSRLEKSSGAMSGRIGKPSVLQTVSFTPCILSKIPHHAKQKSTRFVLPSRLICYFTRLHTDSALVPVEVAGFVL
jgi:hypothetical protein